MHRNLFFIVVKHTKSLGASEDLVVATAEHLAAQGEQSAFWFNFRPPESDRRIQRLRAAGCRIYYPNLNGLSARLARRILKTATQRLVKKSLYNALRSEQPGMAILNQGGNSDAWSEAPVLQESAIPYIVLCHAATESTWPNPEFLPRMRTIYNAAKRCLFVSEDIRQLTEAQLGRRLPNTSVVYNPCKFSEIQECPWPVHKDFSLAAVSRIENRSKGHDLILQTLARPEWRERPLSVTFYGEGPHREALEYYAAYLGLNSVHFAGHVDKVNTIWEQHHGFIQTSRYEGYGLSLLEAMFCQRMAIATPFPAAKEFITESETGFLARAASVDEIAAALERAWMQKDDWQSMGKSAAKRVEASYPKDPVKDFLNLVQEIS